MSLSVKDGFTAGQASKLSGVPYRTLDYWATSRFITPSMAGAKGKGTQRLYSFPDLVALRVAQQLRTAGISLQALRKVVRYLRTRRKTASFANTYLVSDGKDVFERRGDDLISTLRQPGQMASAWIIDLGQVVEELQKAIAV
ncbi:MAG: helix-turn-helix domain-containing protein [Chloroflexota bacterium]|jgi:DNA-binding transcriptional MerR regulator